ncbi:hypothetical protein MRB53_011536 [Persea americana]|uniref:Uncharacterized protein n=1 Tax=Persea americana TaxID=3435 RepID=A0ACC2LV24_PERAE|nr:hypothetical protein MRB53_011536 [Persea americana]
MAVNKTLALSLSSLSLIKQSASFSPSSSPPPHLFHLSASTSFSPPPRLSVVYSLRFQYPSASITTPPTQPSLSFSLQRKRLCRAAESAEYVFPDPIPEFADSETEKFRAHLLKKLPKKDIFGDSVNEVVEICTEIFSNFLHTEYGGPGTLLVVPFIDMADTLNERGLPGGPQAARAAVVWAQKHVDNDWNAWTGGDDDSAE